MWILLNGVALSRMHKKATPVLGELYWVKCHPPELEVNEVSGAQLS